MQTSYETTELPAWPVYALTVHDGGQVDASGPLVPAAGHPDRASAVDTVAAAAARLGRPVRAEATEPDGAVWHLVISPDGTVGELPGGEQRTRAPKKRTEKLDRAGSVPAQPPAPAVPARNDGTAGAKAPASVRRPDPATGAPIPSGQAGPAAAPAALQAPEPEAEPPAETRGDTESLALVAGLLQAGRLGEADALAARLDEQASDALGISHPDALHIRETRARVTALAGNTVAGVLLFRDVAERWHYQGGAEQAEAAAVRAETLWLEITDLGPALSAGIAVIRMRNQIPGERGEALAAALEHKAWLEAAAGAAGEPLPPEHTTAVPPGTTRIHGPVHSWERPAQELRAPT
ncbi:hypothetical protein [Streptomyces mirabilis]